MGLKGLNTHTFTFNSTLKIQFSLPPQAQRPFKTPLPLAGTSALPSPALLKHQFGVVGLMFGADKHLMGKSHWIGEQASVLSFN